MAKGENPTHTGVMSVMVDADGNEVKDKFGNRQYRIAIWKFVPKAQRSGSSGEL